MVRGIERCKIFRSNKDREDLLNRLADIVVSSGTSVSELGIPAVRGAKLLGVTVPSVLQAIEKGRDLVEEADWDVGGLLDLLQ